jgi:spore germination cell wall hydrolase CwlJ-like protein
MKILITWAIMSLTVLQINVASAKNNPSPTTDTQLLCLAKNIYYEAGLESREGMIAVAQVTINRTATGKFPKTVCGVVNQKTKLDNKTICQFSWVCSRTAPVSMLSDTWQNSLAVATEVMYSSLRLENAAMAEALYFHSIHVRPNWRLEKLDKIGNHIFYSGDSALRKKKLTSHQG